MPVLLGEHRHLFGMMTVPESVTRNAGVIILNAGLLHNVGPFRLHIDIAEALSRSGFPVLRIDQSGKGESANRTGRSRLDTMMLDYEDCLRELRRIGVTNIIIIGLCSGADDGLIIASQKDSVAGLVMMDGYSRRTWRYFFEHYKKRILSAKEWKRLSSRLIDPGRHRNDYRGTEEAAMNIRGWTSDEEMFQYFQKTFSHDAKVLAIFTSGQDYYNKHGQLVSCIGHRESSGTLEEIFFEDADHTYTVCEHRDRLISSITSWAQRNF